MNKYLLLSLLLIISFNSFSQGKTYYWSDNRKIELSIDSTTFILLSKSVSESERIIRNITGVKTTKSLRSEFFLIELAQKGNHINLLRNNTAIKNINYTYLNSLGRKVIPTGEILIHPKRGHSLLSIISKFQLSIQSASDYGDYILRVESNTNILEIANTIYESGMVEYAHPNFLADITLNQNDPLYPDQYYLNNTGQFGGTAGIDINGPQAWALSNGINNVRVAVIDDGVENHEDINGRVVQGFTPTNANGFGAPIANGSHGQQCAGIIAATTNNSLGIAGITPCSQIVPVNIFNGGEGIQDLVNAIDFAWNQGQADVLSNSWSFTDPNAEFDAITQAITRARTQGRGGLGSIVVFSSGNNQQNFNGVMFPGRANGVVTVGAIDRSGNIWNYSSRGASMDLVAPSGNVNNAGDVRTTDRMGANGLVAGNYVTTFGGTSAACPQVSGVAALMLSINPNLTEAQVVNILRNTATDMGSSGFDNTFGTGRLNAQTAIQQVLPTIGGGNILCTTNSNYILSFIPPNSTVTWSGSPLSSFATGGGANTNGTGGTATVRAASNFVGSATISFVIQGNCNATTVTRTILVGNSPPLGLSSVNSNCSGNSFNVLNTSLSGICSANTAVYFTYNITDPNYSNFVYTPVSIPSGASWSGGGRNLNVTVYTPSSSGSRTATIALSATGPCGAYNVNFNSSADSS